MEVAVQADPIHCLVAQLMGEVGGETPEPTEMTKSVLVREGHYCGRAFTFRDLRAVWFAEANEIKIYRERGPLLRAVRLDGRTEMCRAA